MYSVSNEIRMKLTNGIHVAEKDVLDLNKYYKIVGRKDSPLDWAIKNYDLELLLNLLTLKLDLNSLDKRHETILSIACRKNFDKAIMHILETRRCDFRQLNNVGQSAFFQAVKRDKILNEHTGIKTNYEATMKAIIDHGKNVFVSSKTEIQYWTIIELILDNNVALLDEVLQVTVDCDFTSTRFESPIQIALLLEKYDAVELLLEKDAKINNYHSKNLGWNLISEVIAKKNIDLLLKSIFYGVNINPARGIHPLYKAIFFQDDTFLICLLNNNANLNVSTNDDGMPIISILAQLENEEKLEILLNYEVDINLQDYSGNTALHHAVMNLPYQIQQEGNDVYNFNIIKLLLENNANVNATNFLGETPLMLAAKLHVKDLVEILCGAGADIYQYDQYKRSCLHYALYNKDDDVLEKLLEYGGDLFQKDFNGNIPLHAKDLDNSSFGISRTKVELLIRYGSDLISKNKTNELPIPLIKKKQREPCLLNDFFEKCQALGMKVPTPILVGFSLNCDHEQNCFNQDYAHNVHNMDITILEIEDMKKVILATRPKISLYDFITFTDEKNIDFNERALFPRMAMQNEELEGLKPNFSSRFPAYAEFQHSTVQLYQNRYKLVLNAAEVFAGMIGQSSPPDISEEIFSHLSNQELRKLCS